MPSIIIEESNQSPVRLHANGHGAVLLIGVEADIDELFIPLLNDTPDIRWRYANEPGDAPEAVAPAAGFDADSVIVGKVDDVLARLPDLTAAELESVRNAEADREVARKSVLAAIDKALAETNEGDDH